MREMLTAAQAAEMLGVDKRTVLRLARDGKLRSYRTPGGQHRFRREDVEALASGDGRPSRPSASTIQNKREEIESLNLEVQVRRAKRELARVEAEDAEAEAQARAQEQRRKEREQRARAELEAEAARQAREEKQREAKEYWIEFALSLLPADAPPAMKTATVKFMREAYAQLGGGYWDGSADDPDIMDIANEAVTKAMAPFERQKAIDKIIEKAPAVLPWQCRSLSGLSLTEWERRAKLEARNAIRGLPDGYSIEEVRYAAEEAARRVGAEYTHGQAEKWHRDEIESAVMWLSGDEQQAVKNALAKLPAGCGRAEMERAKERALAPIREAAEVRSKEIQAAKQAEFRKESERIQVQVQSQLAQSRAENDADRLLSYVREYVDQLCNEDDELELELWERLNLADRIKNQLRPKFTEVLLRGELDDESAHELIEEAVHGAI